MKYKILIVDDEEKINEVLNDYLSSLGYQVFKAYDGKGAIDSFLKFAPDLIILDLMLPDMNGEDVCRTIRRKSRVPVIMLTAKITEEEMINGFNIGADDYIFKPFSLKEIGVRIKAVLRRTETDKLLESSLSFKDGYLIIDYGAKSVKVSGENAGLTQTEFGILSTLAKSPNKAFSREQLISFALGDDFLGYDRTIDTYIKTIRQKIEQNPKNPEFIVTVHGVGYKFNGG